jgi:hypothetical protein
MVNPPSCYLLSQWRGLKDFASRSMQSWLVGPSGIGRQVYDSEQRVDHWHLRFLARAGIAGGNFNRTRLLWTITFPLISFLSPRFLVSSRGGFAIVRRSRV